MEYYLTPQFIAATLQIIWIDLLLSGDNAVVIALACRQLPGRQRLIGMILGAGAARGHPELFVFGLLLSIPLVVAGSGLLLNIIGRFPIIVWAGAALLGWIAGEMIFGDPVVLRLLQTYLPGLVRIVPVDQNPAGLDAVGVVHYGAAAVGAALVLAIGWMLKKRPEPPVPA
jgi:predicted tellurium resistance membrane protein TerC